jgi:hypothetical protein
MLTATVMGSGSNGLSAAIVLAPDKGETAAQVFYRDDPHPQAPHLQPDAYGLIWMPQEGFQNAFAQNASDDAKALTASVQRLPISIADAGHSTDARTRIFTFVKN